MGLIEEIRSSSASDIAWILVTLGGSKIPRCIFDQANHKCQCKISVFKHSLHFVSLNQKWSTCADRIQRAYLATPLRSARFDPPLFIFYQNKIGFLRHAVLGYARVFLFVLFNKNTFTATCLVWQRKKESISALPSLQVQRHNKDRNPSMLLPSHSFSFCSNFKFDDLILQTTKRPTVVP